MLVSDYVRMSTTTSVESQTSSDWLTVTMAAKELHSGRRPVYKAIQDGALRAATINGRGDFRIHRRWLADWLEALARLD